MRPSLGPRNTGRPAEARSSSSPSPKDADAAEVLYRADGCLFGSWKNVFVAVWTVQSTGPLAAKFSEISLSFARSHPEGFSGIHVIAEKPPLPTAEARQEFSTLVERYGDRLACVGTVLEGSGFWASALRSLLVGFKLIAKRPFELQFYSTLPEVSAWLPSPHASRTGVSITQADLQRVLEVLRDAATREPFRKP